MNQQELENKLKQAQNAYYNGSEPIMSDLEYDELWDELQTNYPDSQLLQEVGMDHTDGFAKVKHSIIMGSQNKANKPAEMDEWFDRCRNKRHKVVIETEKLDGCSIALEYRNGVFTQGITRGDGEEGDDITENVRKMQGVPANVPHNYTGTVRGEVLLYRSDMERYFPGQYKNCRNAASGIMKHLDGADCDKLHIKVYEARKLEGERFKFQHEMLAWMTHAGFDVVPYKMHNLNELTGETAIQIMKERWAQERDYNIDGLVWKTNLIDYEDLESNYRPKYAIALKPKYTLAETTIEGIEWSVKNGTLTPVALVTPVDINGSTIKRSSLCNIAMLEELGIEIGHRIIITKAGEIIPTILSDLTTGKCRSGYEF